jgi:hypothetical protein
MMFVPDTQETALLHLFGTSEMRNVSPWFWREKQLRHWPAAFRAKRQSRPGLFRDAARRPKHCKMLLVGHTKANARPDSGHLRCGVHKQQPDKKTQENAIARSWKESDVHGQRRGQPACKLLIFTL